MSAQPPPSAEQEAPDFFTRPILNSPYEYPSHHWELDENGQPTQRIVHERRRAKFVTAVPRPKRVSARQRELALGEADGLSTEAQRYDPTPIINELRRRVDAWRDLKNPDHWSVTPETRRLLQHWRHHSFSGIRPFFCQIEAVEAAIWLTEVAPFGARQEWTRSATEKRPSLRSRCGAGCFGVFSVCGRWFGGAGS